MKIYVYVLTFCTLLMQSCTADTQNTFTFPILAECKKKALDILSRKNNLKYRFVAFDVGFDSHIDVVGFMEVKGSNIKIEDLEIVRNTIRSKCGMTTIKTIPKKSSDYYDELSNYLHLSEITGKQHFYIKVEPTEIRVYSRANY